MVKICKGGHHRQPFFSVCWLWNRKLAALPLLIWRKRSESQHNCRSQSECPGSWASQQAWLPSLPSLSLECCLCKNFIKASEWCYASLFDTLELQHRCFNLKGSIHSRQAEWQGGPQGPRENRRDTGRQRSARRVFEWMIGENSRPIPRGIRPNDSLFAAA